MSAIDRDGVAINYDVRGDGDGTAVLLSHGYGATSRMFESTVAALATSHRCLTWDVRGHGSFRIWPVNEPARETNRPRSPTKSPCEPLWHAL